MILMGAVTSEALLQESLVEPLPGPVELAPVRSWDSDIPQPNTGGSQSEGFPSIIQSVRPDLGVGMVRANSPRESAWMYPVKMPGENA